MTRARSNATAGVGRRKGHRWFAITFPRVSRADGRAALRADASGAPAVGGAEHGELCREVGARGASNVTYGAPASVSAVAIVLRKSQIHESRMTDCWVVCLPFRLGRLAGRLACPRRAELPERSARNDVTIALTVAICASAR